MKNKAGRLMAMALAVILAVGAAGETAFASEALGSELVERTAELANGVSLTTQSLWSASKSDLRTEHYLTYTPGGTVKPVVYSGTYVTSTNTVAAAAAGLQAQGYRVAAAINGGFFNTDGTIVGMLVTDGVIRSLDVENYKMLGFTNDGRVFIDESNVIKKVSWQREGEDFTFGLAGYNAYRHKNYTNEAFLYSNDFNPKVNSSTDNVYAILRPVDGGAMKMNSSLKLAVVSVADTAREGVNFDGKIPDGCYMLYAEYHENNEWLTNGIRALIPGQEVTVSVSGVSEQWTDAAFGISGLYTLLREGKVVSNLPVSANPYTAVGVKENGAAVFYTIDGRQSGYSVGATYAQVADRLRELGCITAVALDGGGSTNLGATLPGSSDFSILNRPSTSGRWVNNTILLVAENGDAGLTPGFYLSCGTQVMLVGASLNVSAVGYDRWGKADSSMTPSWSATGGSIEGNGLTAVYTAGSAAGTYAVSAGAGSDLPVRVVSTLSSLRVSREGSSAAVSSLNLKPGDAVDLTASGTWWNLPVAMDDGSVKWSADASIGTIDASGRFRAAEGYQGASGKITAAAGGRTVTIQVTVQANYPFTDIENHWSADYVSRLYELGLTQGIEQPDGTYIFNPSGNLSRGELFAFITRLLDVDTAEYQNVALPFEDAGSIVGWQLPYVKALYALGVLSGSSSGGKLYANVDGSISREETMTMLGRILADQVSQDLSGFDDSGSVSGWARPYVETLVGLNVVQGSDGKLSPKSEITRGETAKLLVELSALKKAELTRSRSGQ